MSEVSFIKILSHARMLQGMYKPVWPSGGRQLVVGVTTSVAMIKNENYMNQLTGSRGNSWENGIKPGFLWQLQTFLSVADKLLQNSVALKD